MDFRFTEVADYCREVLSLIEQAEKSEDVRDKVDDNGSLDDAKLNAFLLGDVLNEFLASRLREIVAIVDHGKKSSALLKQVVRQRDEALELQAHLQRGLEEASSHEQSEDPCYQEARTQMEDCLKEADHLEREASQLASDLDLEIFLACSPDLPPRAAVATWGKVSELIQEMQDLHHQTMDALCVCDEAFETISE